MPFEHTRLSELPLVPTTAHGGVGKILFHRIASAEDVAGPVNFLDYAVLPPGTSVGLHTHGEDEEEYYLILEGEGRMARGDAILHVVAGDLIRNPPEGTHGLTCTSTVPLRMFVFEVRR